MAFVAPGMTVTEIQDRVAQVTNKSTGNSTDLAEINEAITVAGQTAATWHGRIPWFAISTGTFDTVASTASYALRTVNSNDMTDLYAPVMMMIEDDWQLRQIPFADYEASLRIFDDDSEPYSYALAGDLTAYLYPTPDAVYTIYVTYVQRHSKIGGTYASPTGDLLIPAEFHRSIYVDGAATLLKADSVDPSVLANDTRFSSAMNRIYAADPAKNYDTPGEVGFPPDSRVWISGTPTGI